MNRKIHESGQRIREWYDAWGGNVHISFSGGLDSTVMLHMVRSIYPQIPAVFCNTGLEYPEIIKFVKHTDDVTILRPEMPFYKILDRYGYPVVSKRNAQYIGEVQSALAQGKNNSATFRLRTTGIRPNGQYSQMSMIPKKWQYLINAPFKISPKCCDVMKKKPFKQYERKAGSLPFVGIVAEESQQRISSYCAYGCNAFENKRPTSTPLAFWTKKDIRLYIKKYNLSYSKIYDMGEERTGCIFCLFGVHLDKQPNRIIRLQETHPKYYKYCIEKLGIGKVMEYIGVPYRYDQLQHQIKLFT